VREKDDLDAYLDRIWLIFIRKKVDFYYLKLGINDVDLLNLIMSMFSGHNLSPK